MITSKAAEAQQQCQKCGGKGFHRTTKDGYEVVIGCACRRQARLEGFLDRANIPEKYWQNTLQADPSDDRNPFKTLDKRLNAVVHQTQNEVLDKLRHLYSIYKQAYLENKTLKDIHGMLLYGPCGTGKTHLVSGLLVDLIHAGLTDVYFVEYAELFQNIRFSYNSQEENYQSVMEGLITPKILVIDDFGTQISGNLIWVLDKIGFIINERYNKNLPTLLTCNNWKSLEEEQAARGSTKHKENVYENVTFAHQLPKAIAKNDAQRLEKEEIDATMEQVSVRVKSRIREMCEEVKMVGPDYREKKNKIRSVKLRHQ